MTRRLLPLTAAGTGVVLVVVSGILLFRDTPMPTDFGAVPGDRPAAVAPASTTRPTDAGGPVGSRSNTTGSSITRPAVPTSHPTGTSPAARADTSPTTRTPAPPTSAPPSQDTTGAATAPHRPGASPTHSGSVAPTTTKPFPSAAPSRTLVPTKLTLQRFGITADVLPVASENGALQVPEDPAQVGWWVGSALPGSASGTTVLDGHINSASAGAGAFLQLSELTAGDRVQVHGATGVLGYRVVARRVFAKSEGLPSSLFGLTGAPRLLLISCGGQFDADRGTYEDNVVVFAVPSAP